ncbi:hypothetical protein [Spirochaeta isovalerica]|uniref:Lipoprotein n=1 Tax=Spirochaeta isovalerica TaxID=150 RepID=A0A841R192_9SPIO|nr:hypothetical protein [Spirochaeta isovalerica]MBB6478734.1 hypothetical protein [Spirochaeta isovalerica]
MSKYLKLTIFLGLIVIALTGCDLFSSKLSSSERLEAFEDELNGSSRTTTVNHIHPDALGYSSINEAFWDGGPLSAANRPFDFSGVVLGAENNGIIIGTGIMTNNSGDQTINSIQFKESPVGSNDWYILSIMINGSEIFQ